MAVSVLEKNKTWTYGDYLQLGDDRRFEIVEGALILNPAPNRLHQRICRNLAFVLWNYVRKHGLGEVFFAPFDVALDRLNVVQPDLIYVAKERESIFTDQGIEGVPDLLVEVLSQATIDKDRVIKRNLYQLKGVPELWLVDPAEREVEVLTLGKKGYETFCRAGAEAPVRSKILEDFTIKTCEIFG